MANKSKQKWTRSGARDPETFDELVEWMSEVMSGEEEHSLRVVPGLDAECELLGDLQRVQRDLKEFKAGKVYDVLVMYAGASAEPQTRDAFVQAISEGCTEFRFQGKLGFGGKYRPKTNTVDCYPEDLNQLREYVIANTNSALRMLTRKGN